MSSSLRKLLGTVVLVTMVPVYAMFAMLVGYQVPDFPGARWIAPLLGTVMYVVGGRPFLTGAVSEIRDHSERIHQLGGDNLLRIGQGRSQGENLLVLGGQLHTAVQAFRV